MAESNYIGSKLDDNKFGSLEASKLRDKKRHELNAQMGQNNKDERLARRMYRRAMRSDNPDQIGRTMEVLKQFQAGGGNYSGISTRAIKEERATEQLWGRESDARMMTGQNQQAGQAQQWTPQQADAAWAAVQQDNGGTKDFWANQPVFHMQSPASNRFMSPVSDRFVGTSPGSPGVPGALGIPVAPSPSAPRNDAFGFLKGAVQKGMDAVSGIFQPKSASANPAVNELEIDASGGLGMASNAWVNQKRPEAVQRLEKKEDYWISEKKGIMYFPVPKSKEKAVQAAREFLNRPENLWARNQEIEEKEMERQVAKEIRLMSPSERMAYWHSGRKPKKMDSEIVKK